MPVIMTTFILFISSSAQSASEKNYQSAGEAFRFEILTQQKDVVWGFDFINEDQLIFTERGGALRSLNLKSKTVSNIDGVPIVYASGQGGLLDVRVHPKEKSKIYFSFSEPTKDGATTALAFAILQGASLTNFKKIFSAHQPNLNTIHFGSRIEFDGKGHLWLSIGDRDQRDRAQSLNFHNGKIIRLNEDGSIPADNPFSKDKTIKPEVWSYGHRNPQGLVRNTKTGELWEAEMGPRGGDELNLIRAGLNYGWPVITYGREYYGPKIGLGTSKEGMEQPIAYWVPSISPSALTIYTGHRFPKWQDNIFIGTLSGQHLRRLRLENSRVVEQEALLNDLQLRIRNVRTGLDGYLYFSTDDGKIARLVPVQTVNKQ